MKARNFRYIKPTSLEQAYRILKDAGRDAVPVAGGQSLLAGLNMRLSAPELLVDIDDLPELGHCGQYGNFIRLGATTRHRELLQSELVRTNAPLLSQAAAHIGHVAIRNRGTLAGSLAYADPAAELPACCVALDATLILGSLDGERQVKAEDFFTGLFETALLPGELIIGVTIPIAPAGTLVGFGELSRRQGDFALAGLAAVATTDRSQITSARLVYFGCTDRAKVARSVSAAIAGQHLPLSNAGDLESALAEDITPEDTPGLRGETRRHLAAVLTRRVLNALTNTGTAA